jgi:hypothetical protein
MQVPRPRVARGASGVQGRRAGTDSAGRPAGEDPEPVMPAAGTPSVACHRPEAFPLAANGRDGVGVLYKSMVRALWLASLVMG